MEGDVAHTDESAHRLNQGNHEIPKIMAFKGNVALYFSPTGKTEGYKGIHPSAVVEKKSRLRSVLPYALLGFDALEVGIAYASGFGIDDYIMIGATSIACVVSWVANKRKGPQNYFKIEGDKISFSRIIETGAFFDLWHLLKPTPPTEAHAADIKSIEIQLEETFIILKNGKKECLNLANLAAKRTIQDALLYFCEKNNLPSQISALSQKERQGAM